MIDAGRIVGDVEPGVYWPVLAVLAVLIARAMFRHEDGVAARRAAIKRGELPPDPAPSGWVDPRRNAPANGRGASRAARLGAAWGRWRAR